MKNDQKIKPKPRGMKTLYALGAKQAFDLSLSENPLGCSPLVMERLKQNDFAFNDYPTPNGQRLKQALAAKLGCEAKNIFVDNGSEAIINAIPKVFAKPNDEAIMPALSFPMFSICSELAGLIVRPVPMDEQFGIDLKAIAARVNPRTRLIFVCNPNNPTGSVISRKELARFIEQIPEDILIVIDEANIEFGGESVIDLTLTRPNIMVLRTLSKGFGLANLRLGFAIGDPRLISKLEEETPVFPISGLSEELAIAALNDGDFIIKTKAFIDGQRERVRLQLEELGFRVFPSQANNLFVELPDFLSAETFWTVMDGAGISLVKGSSFPGFDDRFFRVSPRLENVNDTFLGAVKAVMEGSGL